MSQPLLAEVFTPDEVARAAGVSRREVDSLVASGEIRLIPGTRYMRGADAVGVARRLRRAALASLQHMSPPAIFALTSRPPGGERRPGLPAFASSAVHAALIALALWLSAGVTNMAALDETPRQPTRLVFLMSPGPGGGGGGGGLRNPLPPPQLQRPSPQRARVSVPAVERKPVIVTRREVPEPRKPTPVVAQVPRPVERAPEPLPSRVLVAPVVAAAAAPQEREGVIDEPRETVASNGPGSGGGVGATTGTGNGEGFGSGIDEGEGGGAGGGPYRPGSGITPPRLLREVKADYTDDARRRGLTGDVLLEIVVLRDGSVGDVSVLRGLGGGLDQRAIAAVRQWRFNPAQRRGVPVDVIVEVAVEFTLR